MWWEPRSENDQRVLTAVTTMAARLREGVAVLPFLPAEAVHGVGSVLVGPGRRHPLLVLGMEWNFSRWRLMLPYRFGLYDLLYRPGLDPYVRMQLYEELRRYELLRDHFGRNPWQRLVALGEYFLPSGLFRRWSPREPKSWHRLTLLRDYFIPLGLVRKWSPREFELVDVPEDCLLLFELPAEPLFGGGMRLRSGGRRGSVGLAVEITAADGSSARGFTTAGHVIDGQTVQRSTRLLGVFRRFVHAETIMLRADCTTDPSADGYDIAVAVSRASLTVPTSLRIAGVAQASETGATLGPGCAMWGGESGVRNGFLFSAMKLERNGNTWWQDCWRVVGERGWFVKAGDSGAPVTLHGSGRILGHVVCGVGTQHVGRFEAGLVQDIGSQLVHLRTKFKVTLT